MKILFQGDSITDAGRTADPVRGLGNGYPKYAADALLAARPDLSFTFINRGVGGNKIEDLVARLGPDLVDIQPDIVSVLIGINDVWAHAGKRDWMPDAVFEGHYRTILDTIRTQTHAQILLLEPFLLPVPDKAHFREDLWRKTEITRALAREYAIAYLPTDGLLAAACVGDDPLTLSPDGVHPTEKGAALIGHAYAEALLPHLPQ